MTEETPKAKKTKTEAVDTAPAAGTDWTQVRAPRELLWLKPGDLLVMKGSNGRVASVDRKGRPLTLDCRDAEGKLTRGVPFVLEDFVKVK